ncbi:MAG: hypothetical protein AAF597_07825 [Bacteroidota bacterium]
MQIRLILLAISILICFGSCSKDSVFGEREVLFGFWIADINVTTTFSDGTDAREYTEDNTTMHFFEDGTLIHDRGFFRDTMNYFYVPDPEAVIFGDYVGTQSPFGIPGVFAQYHNILERSENRIVLGGDNMFVDTAGVEVHVMERWELTR